MKAELQFASELLSLYGGDGRAYHNVEHLRDCLAKGLAVQLPQEGMVALWYHDAIYVPMAKDNEERSAALYAAHARSVGTPEAEIELVSHLILSTKHAQPPQSSLEAMVRDIDMSILGAPPEVFDAYDAAIRKEYAAAPDDLYEAGRCAFLRGLLVPAPIFHTDEWRGRYESRARENIARRLRRADATPKETPRL